MKFKVWIQTAFVFNFKKIKCFVIVAESCIGGEMQLPQEGNVYLGLARV